MKKQYVAPIAEKVDFDYEENVTASGAREEIPQVVPASTITPATPTSSGCPCGIIELILYWLNPFHWR
jgi:hypothetical protein